MNRRVTILFISLIFLTLEPFHVNFSSFQPVALSCMLEAPGEVFAGETFTLTLTVYTTELELTPILNVTPNLRIEDPSILIVQRGPTPRKANLTGPSNLTFTYMLKALRPGTTLVEGTASGYSQILENYVVSEACLTGVTVTGVCKLHVSVALNDTELTVGEAILISASIEVPEYSPPHTMITPLISQEGTGGARIMSGPNPPSISLLNPGEKAEVTWIAKAESEGTVTFHITAESICQGEKYRSEPATTPQVEISPPPPVEYIYVVDLSCTQISSNNTSPRPDEPFRVTATIASTGNKTVTFNAYLTLEPLPEGYILGNITRTLKPGETCQIWADLVLNITGEHNICLYIDPKNRIQETNEENNNCTITITIPPVETTPPPTPSPTIDLYCTSIEVNPPKAKPGEEIAIQVTIGASGTLWPTPEFYVQTILYTAPEGTEIGAERIIMESPGQKTLTFKIVVEEPGKYVLKTIVDPYNSVKEENEENNDCNTIIEIINKTTYTPSPTGEKPPEIEREKTFLTLAIIGLIAVTAVSIYIWREGFYAPTVKVPCCLDWELKHGYVWLETVKPKPHKMEKEPEEVGHGELLAPIGGFLPLVAQAKDKDKLILKVKKCGDNKTGVKEIVLPDNIRYKWEIIEGPGYLLSPLGEPHIHSSESYGPVAVYVAPATPPSKGKGKVKIRITADDLQGKIYGVDSPSKSNEINIRIVDPIKFESIQANYQRVKMEKEEEYRPKVSEGDLMEWRSQIEPKLEKLWDEYVKLCNEILDLLGIVEEEIRRKDTSIEEVIDYDKFSCEPGHIEKVIKEVEEQAKNLGIEERVRDSLENAKKKLEDAKKLLRKWTDLKKTLKADEETRKACDLKVRWETYEPIKGGITHPIKPKPEHWWQERDTLMKNAINRRIEELKRRKEIIEYEIAQINRKLSPKKEDFITNIDYFHRIVKEHYLKDCVSVPPQIRKLLYEIRDEISNALGNGNYEEAKNEYSNFIDYLKSQYGTVRDEFNRLKEALKRYNAEKRTVESKIKELEKIRGKLSDNFAYLPIRLRPRQVVLLRADADDVDKLHIEYRGDGGVVGKDLLFKDWIGYEWFVDRLEEQSGLDAGGFLVRRYGRSIAYITAVAEGFVKITCEMFDSRIQAVDGKISDTIVLEIEGSDPVEEMRKNVEKASKLLKEAERLKKMSSTYVESMEKEVKRLNEKCEYKKRVEEICEWVKWVATIVLTVLTGGFSELIGPILSGVTSIVSLTDTIISKVNELSTKEDFTPGEASSAVLKEVVDDLEENLKKLQEAPIRANRELLERYWSQYHENENYGFEEGQWNLIRDEDEYPCRVLEYKRALLHFYHSWKDACEKFYDATKFIHGKAMEEYERIERNYRMLDSLKAG